MAVKNSNLGVTGSQMELVKQTWQLFSCDVGNSFRCYF